MRICLLGPVQVWSGDEQICFIRRQQRVILGILALAPNVLVTCDRLIELIWEGNPPPQARAIVQSRVSEVRKALVGRSTGPETPALITRAGGYQLTISPDEIDVYEFYELCDSARAAEGQSTSRDLLRQALALWRGPVLGTDLSSYAYACLGHGLESSRLTAIEDLYDIELRLGNHRGIADDARAAAAMNPSRERLMRLAMLALHRSGRAADALRDYDRWRRWLGETYGADPGVEIQQLHLAIVRQDPSVGVPAASDPTWAATSVIPSFSAATPRTLPPDIADFTGRSGEIGVLRDLLTGVPATPVVAVSGPGGIGKTALCVHVGHQLRDEFCDGSLYVNLGGPDRDNQADPHEVIGRFLRALGVETIPSSPNERIDLYRDLLCERRVLLLLDNATDEIQILPLLPGGRHTRVVITSRSRLGATVGARPVSLDVLDPAEAVSLVTRIAGHQDGDVAQLCALCGHLPLALRIAAAKLSVKPHWTVGRLIRQLRDERNRLNHLSHGPLDVRASIALSYAGLPVDDQRLLRALGELDLPETPIWTAAAILDTDLEHAEACLERLFDAQLIEVARARHCAHSRYRMHDLIRLFAKERAARDDNADELFKARERVYGAWLHISDVAREALHCVDYTNGQRVARRWPFANEEIDDLVAAPQEWFEQERHNVVSVIERAALDRQSSVCTELVDATSMLFAMRRHFDQWRRAVDSSIDLARACGDRRNEAVLLCRLGLAHSAMVRDRDAYPLFIQSAKLFAELGDRHAEATAMAWSVMLLRAERRDDEAMEVLTAVYEIFQTFDDRDAMAFTAQRIGRIHLDHDEYDSAREYLEHALGLFRATGGRQGEAQALFWRGMLWLRQEIYAEARADFRQAIATSRAMGDRSGVAQCLRGLALIYSGQGARDRSKALLLEALAMVHQPTPSRVEELIRGDLAKL